MALVRELLTTLALHAQLRCPAGACIVRDAARAGNSKEWPGYVDSKVFEHRPHLRREETYSGILLNLCVRLSTRTDRAKSRHGFAPELDMAPLAALLLSCFSTHAWCAKQLQRALKASPMLD